MGNKNSKVVLVKIASLSGQKGPFSNITNWLCTIIKRFSNIEINVVIL